MLTFLVLFAFVGPLIDTHAAAHYNMSQQFLPPSPAHLLGTNVLGQGELGQLMIGGQRPIIAGFIAAIAASILGVAVGIVAGYGGRFVDAMLMRVTDMFLSIPQAVPILLIESLFGASTRSLIIVVSLTSWPTVARLIRGRALVVKNLPFMEAARASGGSKGRIVMRHLIPNMLDEIVVSSTNQFANVVLIMALTTFVG
ncbi:binding-protein-dependent transport system inner membrane component, partial [mine drainage metagenome]